MSSKQGIIFDMDGLMIDSERIINDAVVRAGHDMDWRISSISALKPSAPAMTTPVRSTGKLTAILILSILWT